MWWRSTLIPNGCLEAQKCSRAQGRQAACGAACPVSSSQIPAAHICSESAPSAQSSLSALTIILIQQKPKAAASPVGNLSDEYGSEDFQERKCRLLLNISFWATPAMPGLPGTAITSKCLDWEFEHSNKFPKQLLHSGSEMSAL